MSNERILVVDDDPVTLKVLEGKFKSGGYEVMSVTNGRAAIQAVKETKPDLMILDLSLPEEDPFAASWDGFGVMEWLRRTQPDDHFPIIFYTVSNDPTVQKRVQAAGAWGLIKKGEDIGELLAAVRKALDERKAV